MPPENSIREYLLGMSDAEMARIIEESLLDGSQDMDRFQCLEDELIDDFAFRRLSAQEEKQFLQHFLSTNERREKLAFSQAFQKFASKRLNRMPAWSNPLLGRVLRLSPASVFVGFVGVIIWLGIETVGVRRDLAQVLLAQRQAVTASRGSAQVLNRELPSANPANAISPVDVLQKNRSAKLQRTPDITIMPGLTRGIEQASILRVGPHENTVWISLQIANDPGGAFREELFAGNGQRIWSQEFSATRSLVTENALNIAIPSLLFQPGDYRIKVEERLKDGTFEVSDTYSFRVAN